MSKITVFTNGCFDVLHRGHIELFKYAASLGNILIVGVDSDAKVKCDKGDDRPYNKLEDRMETLKALRYVDKVYSFNNAFGLEMLVKKVSPDIMIVGSDWQRKTIVGEQYAKEVRFFERINGYSTTQILKDSSHR